MTKVEFQKRMKGILAQLETVKEAIEATEFDLDTAADDLEQLKDEAEETAENVKSEDLQDQWRERANEVEDCIDQLNEFRDVLSNLEEIISELGGIE